MSRILLPVLGTATLLLPSILLGTMAINALAGPRDIDRAASAPLFVGPPTGGAVTNEQTASEPQPSYQAVLERPLFAPTRLPIPIQAVAIESDAETPIVVLDAPVVEVTEIQPPTFELKGVWRNTRASLVYIEQPGRDRVWVGIDYLIDGWQIVEIGRNWVTIAQGGQQIRVSLFE